MSQHQEWINRAAEDVVWETLNSRRFQFIELVANIIAKRAPQVKPFEWVQAHQDKEKCESAETVFGTYYVWWSSTKQAWQLWLPELKTFQSPDFDSIEAAKDAAFADFCARLDLCYKKDTK